MKKSLCILIFLFLFLGCSSKTLAESDYVLPYPSAMPGNIFYKVNLIKERLMKYWYFGDFGQFSYNLKMADKYLVEAKVLFEYKQYLLAYESLKKSDDYFNNIYPNLIKAEDKQKNISAKKELLKNAVLKHTEELSLIKNKLPANFTWQDEKVAPVNLNFQELLNKSIKVRESVL